jgi:hypothetical protein
MQAILMNLIAAARLHNSVASNTLEDGLEIVAYPDASTLLVALGYAGGAPVARARDSILRKRSSDLARYGAWLPSIFDEDNWYVVRRLDNAEAESRGLTDEELQDAWELLN